MRFDPKREQEDPNDVMSDEEYAQDEERKERIRNQRDYDGDYD